MGRRVFWNRGISIADLLVVTGLATALVTIMLGCMATAKSANMRTQCASNLHQIGMAMSMYANGEHNGSFPRCHYDVSAADKPQFFTAVDATNPFGHNGPTNDVTAAMYLLIRTQKLDPKLYVCPATNQKPLALANGKSVNDFSNFPSGDCFSYSMTNPYASRDAITAGFKWNNTLGLDFPTMADRNPGDPILLTITSTSPAGDLHKGNTLNHDQNGQNVLYADGHVEFSVTPFCGSYVAADERDNIYTFGDSGKTSGGKGIVGPSIGALDAVCLPTTTDNGPTK